MRVVTHQEMALERVAVRERREQLGCAQATAERRIERRQGLGLGGELKETLLTQVRALRERISQQLGLVKEWVRERFAEPLQKLKKHAQDLFGTVAEQARGARGPEPEQARARRRQAEPAEPGTPSRARDVERPATPASGTVAPDAAERARRSAGRN